MARKRYTPEEIIQHLRTVEIEQSKGVKQEEVARKKQLLKMSKLMPNLFKKVFSKFKRL